jgi:hypothetical protein
MDSGGAGINGHQLRFWQGDGFDVLKMKDDVHDEVEGDL